MRRLCVTGTPVSIPTTNKKAASVAFGVLQIYINIMD